MEDTTPGPDPSLKTRTTQIRGKRQTHSISQNCGTSPVTKVCTVWKTASPQLKKHPFLGFLQDARGRWERAASGGLRTRMVAQGSRQGSHLAGSPGIGHNGTDLQARHAAEHGRGVSQVNPLGQQVAAIGEIQERLPLLARMVLTAGARHVCLSTPAAPSEHWRAGQRRGRSSAPAPTRQRRAAGGAEERARCRLAAVLLAWADYCDWSVCTVPRPLRPPSHWMHSSDVRPPA